MSKKSPVSVRLRVNRTDVGDVLVWGNGNDGRLGLGDTKAHLSPQPIADLEDADAAQVSCGENHMVALLREPRTVLSWGSGTKGQLGVGDNETYTEPQAVEELNDVPVLQVECGHSFSAARTEDGKVYTWGSNGYGQCGLGHRSDVNTPALVSALEGRNVVDIACGAFHMLAICDNGDVFAWGRGSLGRLGTGNEDDAVEPVPVIALGGHGAALCSCGYDFSFVLTESGALYAFGNGEDGRLGVGDARFEALPRLLQSLEGVRVVFVSCGDYHSAAVTDRGLVYTWGRGDKGRLGHGIDSVEAVPRQIVTLADVTIESVACGANHTAALSRDGMLFTFGSGWTGQLGTGSRSDSLKPVHLHVFDGSMVRQVSCGGDFTAVIRAPLPLLVDKVVNGRDNQEQARSVHALRILSEKRSNHLDMLTEGAMPALLAVLGASEDQRELENAATAVKNLAVENENNCRARLVQQRHFPAVVMLLESKHENLRLLGAEILKIVAGDEEGRAKLLEEGYLLTLVSLLKSGSDALMNMVAEIISSLASSTEGRVRIAHEGGFSFFLSLLDSLNPRVLDLAIEIMGSLASDERSRVQLIDEHHLDPVAILLSFERRDINFVALELLNSVLDEDVLAHTHSKPTMAELRTKLLRRNVLHHCARLLNEDDDAIVSKAITLVEKLLRGADDVVFERAVSDKLVDTIAALTDLQREYEVRLSAARLLSIVAGNALGRNGIFKGGYLGVITDLMRDSDDNIKISAATTVQLLGANDEASARLVEEGTISEFTELLYSDNDGVMAIACETLARLGVTEEVHDRILEEPAIRERLVVLDRYGLGDVQRQAREATRTLELHTMKPNVSDWRPPDVAQWLVFKGFARLRRRIIALKIDGSLLLSDYKRIVKDLPIEDHEREALIEDIEVFGKTSDKKYAEELAERVTIGSSTIPTSDERKRLTARLQKVCDMSKVSVPPVFIILPQSARAQWRARGRWNESSLAIHFVDMHGSWSLSRAPGLPIPDPRHQLPRLLPVARVLLRMCLASRTVVQSVPASLFKGELEGLDAEAQYQRRLALLQSMAKVLAKFFEKDSQQKRRDTAMLSLATTQAMKEASTALLDLESLVHELEDEPSHDLVEVLEEESGAAIWVSPDHALLYRRSPGGDGQQHLVRAADLINKWDDIMKGRPIPKRHRYHVVVRTGDVLGAGTSANVFVDIVGERRATGKRMLRATASDFDRGAEDVFTIDIMDLGDIQKLHIGHDNAGHSPAWFLESVAIMCENTDETWMFPCGRWLSTEDVVSRTDVKLLPEHSVGMKAAESLLTGETVTIQNGLAIEEFVLPFTDPHVRRLDAKLRQCELDVGEQLDRSFERMKGVAVRLKATLDRLLDTTSRSVAASEQEIQDRAMEITHDIEKFLASTTASAMQARIDDFRNATTEDIRSTGTRLSENIRRSEEKLDRAREALETLLDVTADRLSEQLSRTESKLDHTARELAQRIKDVDGKLGDVLGKLQSVFNVTIDAGADDTVAKKPAKGAVRRESDADLGADDAHAQPVDESNL